MGSLGLLAWLYVGMTGLAEGSSMAWSVTLSTRAVGGFLLGQFQLMTNLAEDYLEEHVGQCHIFGD